MKRHYSCITQFASIIIVFAITLSYGSLAYAGNGLGPCAGDLDAIHSDIKYPNCDWMYLDEYISAEVARKSVYCFKDPDNDIWREGNVFIVPGGTEVTILAKSEGYACVILNGTSYAGWINEAYLSEKYSYSINAETQNKLPYDMPGPTDLNGCNEQVQYPKEGNWLQNYETKYLKTKYGKCAYLRYKPSCDSDYYDYVYEKEKLTVLARENGFSLVKSSEGMAGWVTSSLLYDSYPGTTPEYQQKSTDIVFDSQEELFSGTFWNFLFGQTLGSTFIALFHDDGTFTARSYGSGGYDNGSYSYQNGVLTINFWHTGNGCVFDGDANGFVSRQKYEMQVGEDYYTITPYFGDSSIYYSPEMFS